jgi:hypothetical protein
MTTITFQDIEGMGVILNKRTELLTRSLFSKVEGADYDRGDVLFLGTGLGNTINRILDESRVRVDPYIPEGKYLILVGGFVEVTLNRDYGKVYKESLQGN